MSDAQYHFTVFGMVDDDGKVTLSLDDADSGIFPDGTVFEDDDWRRADHDDGSEDWAREDTVANAIDAAFRAFNGKGA